MVSAKLIWRGRGRLSCLRFTASRMPALPREPGFASAPSTRSGFSLMTRDKRHDHQRGVLQNAKRQGWRSGEASEHP
jgi:hypothetical protein